MKKMVTICGIALVAIIASLIACESSINPWAVTGVTLDRADLYLDNGQTRTLSATVSPANATNRAATWSSSDPTVAPFRMVMQA